MGKSKGGAASQSPAANKAAAPSTPPPSAPPRANGKGAGYPTLSPLSVASGMVLSFAVGYGMRGANASPSRTPDATNASRHDPWEFTTHPDMGDEGFNWTQLHMARAGNFPETFVKHIPLQEVEKPGGGLWLWHKTYARSIPAMIHGLATEWSSKLSTWTLADYEREWGEKTVVVAFSPDWKFQRGVPHPEEGRVVQAPDRQKMPFKTYLQHIRSNPEHEGAAEHLAVQQSPSRDFSEFGLPTLPPHLGELVGPTLNARNFWAAAPPKLSILHYDWQDSLLMQLSGTKRFTIIDPARLHTAYPCVQKMLQLKRTAPGVFERVLTSRELDNFPLVNVTHPDLARHPLFKDSHVFTLELKPGDALVLPAYWYHQVESFAPPGQLCVAVNYWFQGHSLATRLYRTLRENVFLNCTEAATRVKPGDPHPCS